MRDMLVATAILLVAALGLPFGLYAAGMFARVAWLIFLAGWDGRAPGERRVSG